MVNKTAIQEKRHTLSELIDYYETCNRAEGKSIKTITWYTANLKRFHFYLKSRHLSKESLNKLLFTRYN